MTPTKYKLDIKAILTITLFPVIILTFSKFGFVLLVNIFTTVLRNLRDIFQPSCTLMMFALFET